MTFFYRTILVLVTVLTNKCSENKLENKEDLQINTINTTPSSVVSKYSPVISYKTSVSSSLVKNSSSVVKNDEKTYFFSPKALNYTLVSVQPSKLTKAKPLTESQEQEIRKLKIDSIKELVFTVVSYMRENKYGYKDMKDIYCFCSKKRHKVFTEDLFLSWLEKNDLDDNSNGLCLCNVIAPSKETKSYAFISNNIQYTDADWIKELVDYINSCHKPDSSDKFNETTLSTFCRNNKHEPFVKCIQKWAQQKSIDIKDGTCICDILCINNSNQLSYNDDDDLEIEEEPKHKCNFCNCKSKCCNCGRCIIL